MTAIASTRLGRLQGVAEPGLFVFRGVPYAAAPVGELRFRAPTPPAPWHGLREARTAGATAPQVLGMMRDLEPQSEDCLYLNIWTPSLTGLPRRVLVFVHGGGFTSGSSTHPMYARSLARFVGQGNCDGMVGEVPCDRTLGYACEATYRS